MKASSFFFVLAYLLFITTTVSSIEDQTGTLEDSRSPNREIAPIPQVKGFSYSPAPGSPPIAQECCWPCMDYCITKPKSKRMCQRVCNACCRDYKCVPGKLNVCKSWDRAVYHGQLTKCP